jgi:hypothetical protein
MILIRIAICMFALALLGLAVSLSTAESGQDYAIDGTVLTTR